MNHIDLTTQEEAVKQFFLALPPGADGSIVELHGRAVARVTPVMEAQHIIHAADTSWTDAKNARRCALVDRDIDGILLPEEAAELAELQQQMLQERRRVAPVPVDELRSLHQKLLAKAQRASQGQ